MSLRMSLLAFCAALTAASGSSRRALPDVRPNSNTTRAGVLRDGALTVTLEATESRFAVDGPGRPPAAIAAFAEAGQQPRMPGPLVRVPLGTLIRFSVRNALASPITFYVPASVQGDTDQSALDSLRVAPGEVGHLAIRATSPGNFLYRAATPVDADTVTLMTGALAGALIVDTAGAPVRPNDRVFVIMATPDSAAAKQLQQKRPLAFATGGPNGFEGIAFTINGRSWPNTERIAGIVGDSLHWRVINASNEPHPMHLHGFYYRVDDFDGPHPEIFGRPAPGQMVVTQLLTPWSGMSMTWSPTRPGNWIFHCHFALHNMPDSIAAATGDPHRRDMVGLVRAADIAARPGARVAQAPAPARHLRLVAIVDSQRPIPVLNPPGRYTPEPSMRFVLEEDGQRIDTKHTFSPELDLVRGEPVSITIVNRLSEPTSVHWHGIEVQDSYMDGAAGMSGEGTHLTPEIAPGDSFEARFTPPRSGTFMYHAHVDEPREEQVGLEGALIVRDRGVGSSPDDHVFFFKGGGINGDPRPDTVVFHVGRPARLRLFNLANWEVTTFFSLTARSDSAAHLANDGSLVRWRLLAKDGFDAPAAQRSPRSARQLVSMGETYDFDYTPTRRENLRLEVRGPEGRLIRSVPIRVE